jgi:hypothetical protein
VAAVGGEQLQGGLDVPGAQGGDELTVLARDVAEVVLRADAYPGEQEQVHLRTDRLPRLP